MEKRRRRKRWEVRDEVEFWKFAFASEPGRRAMWRILKEAGTFELLLGHVNGTAPDPIGSWINAGKREVGLSLYHSWLRTNRDGVLLMLDEHHPAFKPEPVAQPVAQSDQSEDDS